MFNVDAIGKGAEDLEELFFVLLCPQCRVDCLDINLDVLLVLVKVFQILEIAFKVDADAACLLITRRIKALHRDIDIGDARRDECMALLRRQEESIGNHFDAPCNPRLDGHTHIVRQTWIHQRLTKPREYDSLDPALREFFQLADDFLKKNIVDVLHTVTECTELTVRLVTCGVNAVEALEITVLCLFNINGERMCQRDNLRELLPLGIVVWLDFCHRLFSPSGVPSPSGHGTAYTTVSRPIN